MKKIMPLLVAFLLVLNAAGQITIVDNPPLPSVDKTFSDPSSESDRFGDINYILCADSFTLTEETQLLEVEFFGENVNSSFQPSNFSVFIVSNSGSNVPAIDPIIDTPLVSLFRIPLNQGFTITQFNTSTNRTDIKIDFTEANENNPVILPAGDYWMIPAQYVPDGSPGENTFYWGWLGSTNTSPYTPQKITTQFNPVVWEPIAFNGSDATSLSWTLKVEENLSSNEFSSNAVSIYPNPSKDEINVELPNNVDLENITLFNLLGKKVKTEIIDQNTLNIAQLASGTYILVVKTSFGVIRKRIIKE
ncbi:MAG: hypothetical protein ACJAX7_002474 [Saprospiraceae bacterium]|jgi:hypothetical protein|uniref:T9SS type A sorting domain-containing protein n=1 Tax=Candidatus Marifrigoribacter sp. Uisw_064 TaxID=3230970 RepID=UPI003AEBDAD7